MENYDHDYLMHHGTKGMKWGVRRYQNADGSLTLAGRLRYGQQSDGTMSESGKARYKKDVAKLRAKEKVVKNREETAAKLKKLADKEKELEEREAALKGKSKKSDDGEVKSTTDKNTSESNHKLPSKNKKVSEMTNEEIQAKIDRLNLEKKLKDLESAENPKSETGKGKKIVQDILVSSAKNIGEQAVDTLLGTALNKAWESAGMYDPKNDKDKPMVNPAKRQTQKK